MRHQNIFTIVVFSLLITGIFGYKDFLETNKYCFNIEMYASKATSGQIFFDTGNGYNENNSCVLNIQPNSLHKYSFPLPGISIKSICFNLLGNASVVKIKKASIATALGVTIKNLPLRSFKVRNKIFKTEISKDYLIIQTIDNTEYPIIEIENSSFIQKYNWINFFAKRGWIYAGYSILLFIIFFSITKYLVKEIDWVVSRINNYSAKNPKKAIFFIAIIAAVASCYPVVFFNMSFISPSGIAALYDGSPGIPGFPIDAIVENFRGSDVVAMEWSMAPNSVVQHDALFRHFEFPFWTRFVGGGTPLFAQGQSMIGDVLHWIPVAMNGSSMGWDIKFILSKTIFSFGIGLLVFRLTNKLSAGILIAISSCFLGFFAYRFNHPAFFVLTYSPWIVLQWDTLGKTFAFANIRKKSCIVQGILLALITWLQLNAGAPKEGVITTCFMHALGALSFFIHISPKYGKIRSLLFVCGLGFALAMITAPHWLLFLDALGKSYTVYDTPGALTFGPGMIIVFFENFFYQIFYGIIPAPTVNLFILFGVLCAYLNLNFRQSGMVYGSWVLFAVAFATAAGFIPKFILISIPFINNIQHIYNVFSVPAMILALILAGYGIRDYSINSEKMKKKVLIYGIATIVSLLIFSFRIERWRLINFLIIITLVIAFIALAQLYIIASQTSKDNSITFILLAFCFLFVHVRHGMQLPTGITAIDEYVINPTLRGDYSVKSHAIEFVKMKIEQTNKPVRVIGEGTVLFPGYNSRLALEGIVSLEALRNEPYEKLLTLVDYPYHGWGWLRLINKEQIQSRAASLDMLGVGYIVAMPGTKMPQGMKLVYSDDLDVWQRNSVWPRAFFVNTIKEEHKPSDILDALADISHQPFAMIQSQSIPKYIQKNKASYYVIPAKEYTLTNNSTSFSVDANGPGIIVLGETYYPGDFIALLNGKKVNYIRVNEAFKGLWIDKAGKYNVSFTYRPEKLDQALWISFFGFVFLLFLISHDFVGISAKTKG